MGNCTAIVNKNKHKVMRNILNRKKKNKHIVTTIDKQREQTIRGYLSDFTNKSQLDYSFIYTIILLYYSPDYARFFEVDYDTFSEFEEQRNFGDIIQTSDDYFSIVNINNDLVKMGHIELWTDEPSTVSCELFIPFQICKYLQNAIEFYSKIIFDKNSFFDDFGSYGVVLYLKCDDEFIIKCFGGPLCSEYKSIKSRYRNHKFEAVYITFQGKYGKEYNPFKNKINCREIEEFWNCRKNGGKLAKINVKIDPNDPKWNGSTKCPIYSSNWETKWHGKGSYIEQRSWNYIGPKNEKEQMIEKIKEFHPNLKQSYITYQQIIINLDSYNGLKNT